MESSVEFPSLLGVLQDIDRLVQERDDFRDEVERLTEVNKQLVTVLDAHHGVPLKQDNRPKLNALNASLIRKAHADGVFSISELAYKYGVHPSTVSRIVNGKAYA